MASRFDGSPLVSNPAGVPNAQAIAVVSCFPLSHSRPYPPPRLDGSTRHGSLPGHPIPPTAPWPGTPIRDASPLIQRGVRRDAAAPYASSRRRSLPRLG